MKLTDLMNKPMKELLEQCNVTKITPASDEDGNIRKFIVEYEPHTDEIKTVPFVNGISLNKD